MADRNGSQTIPDIGPAELGSETEKTQTSDEIAVSDEQKRLRAIQITILRREQLLDKQKEITNELLRLNENLKNTSADLVMIHQKLSGIQQKINSHLDVINKIQEDIRALHSILEALNSRNLPQTREVAQKVIENHEANNTTNINDSVIKVFDYNKYNYE